MTEYQIRTRIRELETERGKIHYVGMGFEFHGYEQFNLEQGERESAINREIYQLKDELKEIRRPIDEENLRLANIEMHSKCIVNRIDEISRLRFGRQARLNSLLGSMVELANLTADKE